MTRTEEILEILERLPEMKTRKLRMKQLKDFPSNEQWYSWVINDWIPGQPDMADLMNLMILFEFNMHAFYSRSIWAPRGVCKQMIIPINPAFTFTFINGVLVIINTYNLITLKRRNAQLKKLLDGYDDVQKINKQMYLMKVEECERLKKQLEELKK